MTEKCKEQYHRRSFEGLAPLTKEVRAIAMPILGKHGFVSVDILAHWEAIVGPDLAHGIRPDKVTFERDNRTGGILHVKSAGGAFAMLFEHQKARVIERINTFFGYPAVAGIKIRQGALKLARQEEKPNRELTEAERRRLRQRVSVIQDEVLRQKAYDIGEEILLKDAPSKP